MTKGNYYAKPVSPEKIGESAKRIFSELDDGAHFILVKTDDLPDLFRADMKTLLGVAADDIISGVTVTSGEYLLGKDYTVVMLPKAANPETCADIFFKYAKTANLDNFYCTGGEYGSMFMREVVLRPKQVYVIDYLLDTVPNAYENGISVLFLGDEWTDEREDRMSHVGIAVLNGENADASFRKWWTIKTS